jgi:hypothetical protein
MRYEDKSRWTRSSIVTQPTAFSAFFLVAALLSAPAILDCFRSQLLIPTMVNWSQSPQVLNASATGFPILSESTASSLVSTSATAASLLVAVLAFLYNILGSLRRQDYDAHLQYIEARLRYQNNLHQKLKGTGCLLTLKGGTGTRGDFDFEWTSETWAPVTFDLARPDTIKSDLSKLIQPDGDVTLVDAVDRVDKLYKVDSENWIDSVIREQYVKAIRIIFVWVFVKDLANSPFGTLHVQTVFLSPLPKRMQSLSSGLRVIAVAIVAFVVTIASSFLSAVWVPCGLRHLVLLSWMGVGVVWRETDPLANAPYWTTAEDGTGGGDQYTALMKSRPFEKSIFGS